MSELVCIDAGEKDGKKVLIAKRVVTKEETLSDCCGTLEELTRRRLDKQAQLAAIPMQLKEALAQMHRNADDNTSKLKREIAELDHVIEQFAK